MSFREDARGCTGGKEGMARLREVCRVCEDVRKAPDAGVVVKAQ